MGASLLYETLIFLAAAVITVPVFKRLGIGAVLGYLVAGVSIGPWGLGLVADVESILHFAELGVVLLLFVIGLELQPTRLWALRKSVFGYGTLQLFLTGLLLALGGVALGLPIASAVIVGLTLALSSTAFALQLLAERKELTAQHGRLAFAILLFQDLAAIPLIAIIPLLAVVAGGSGAMASATVDFWVIAKAVAVIAAVVVGGHWLLRPFFRLVAATKIPEIFTAAGLLVVIGTALAVQSTGLSMALGAFLAGMLLADSEYRHELEANLDPFKGLLLGLFFISVGMAMNLGLIANQPLIILALVAALLFVKSAVLVVLARIKGQGVRCGIRLALYLSQGGEFAFVVFGLAATAQVMDRALAELLTVVVSVSMMATPLLIVFSERVLGFGRTAPVAAEYDQIEERENRVIIAGFGRFGQMIARTLRMKKIAFTALEISFEQVDFVRKFGNKIYFGDASRLELLRAAKAEEADVFVLAIDDVETSIKTAQLVKRHYPHLKIYARARNRHHVYRLLDVGVDKIVRETFLSSLALASDVLQGLGFSASVAKTAVQRFQDHDEALLRRQYQFHQDEEKLIASVKEAAEELERVFEQDTPEVEDGGARAQPEG